MKKIKMLLCALAMTNASVWAQTTQPCVVVEQTDGTKANYLLASQPRITYAEGEVCLTTTETTVTLPAADVAKVYLSETETTTGVQTAETSSSVLVNLTGGSLALSGLDGGSAVALYDADGRQLCSGTASSDGTLSLSLGSLPSGIIIVKTIHQTFKLIRK